MTTGMEPGTGGEERDTAIRAVAQALVDAWNDRRLQSLAPMLTADAEFVNSLGLWWKGPAEVIQNLDRMSAFGARITADAINVRIVAQDSAVVSLAFTVSGLTDPDGQRRPEQKAVMFLFVVNQGQGWQIAASQTTAVNEALIAQLGTGGNRYPARTPCLHPRERVTALAALSDVRCSEW